MNKGYKLKDYYYFLLRLIVGRKKRDEIRANRRIKKNVKRIKEHGPEALSIMTKIAKEENCYYWLFWGTLLGAYRDTGFIKHDEDIDTGMYDKDITVSFIDKLLASGFRILAIIVDKDFDGGYHLAFDYKGVKLDIYSFHKNEENGKTTAFAPLPYDSSVWGQSKRNDIFDVFHITMTNWESLEEIEFEGIQTWIPDNSDEILRTAYGEDYMTPIVGRKSEDEKGKNKVHENNKEHYACSMNYEVFKMLKNKKFI